MDMANMKKETFFSFIYRKISRSTPYYCYYPVGEIVAKHIRKWFSAVVIPTIPFNNLRLWCYR